MRRQDFEKLVLPDAPGVYLFKKGKEILYIGKATSLRDRMRSYFAGDLVVTRGPLIVSMVFRADNLDWTETPSVLEALILEANLIKEHQPVYNTKEKSDKSFNCVVVTKEDFPRVLILRKKDLLSTLNPKPLTPRAIFGPFPHGGEFKEALKIIRKIFPFRDKCEPCIVQRSSASGLRLSASCKPCFNRQIGLCPGVCTGEISKRDYAKIIRNLVLFFEGKKAQLVRQLEKEMRALAGQQAFEKAGEVKRQIFALNHIQDIALIKTESPHLKPYTLTPFLCIEAYDVAHLSGTDAVGVMVVVEDAVAKKADYRQFKIRGGAGNNDIANLKEILRRRLRHREWPSPALVVVDGGLAQKRAVDNLLARNSLLADVVSVVKDSRHKPSKIIGPTNVVKRHQSAILLANAEAHRFAINFHRARRHRSML